MGARWPTLVSPMSDRPPPARFCDGSDQRRAAECRAVQHRETAPTGRKMSADRARRRNLANRRGLDPLGLGAYSER